MTVAPIFIVAAQYALGLVSLGLLFILPPPIFFAVAPFALVCFLILRIWSGRSVVNAWASSNGYRVVRRLWGGYRVGPYPFAAAFGRQSIHYLEIADSIGNHGRVWLKVGGFMVGHLNDQVEVTWERQLEGVE